MERDFLQRRKEIESRFKWYHRDKGERDEFVSPSGNFRLTIDSYSTGKNTWAYTRGRVRPVGSRKLIADIKRNFSHFWYSWIRHSNGNEYLLCGEDYQGQTVVNLTRGTTNNFFPDSGYEGHGFCWTAAFPSPDSKIIAVDGCYWACPYEIVFFDFTNPDELPYKEYLRVSDQVGCVGWLDDDHFKLTREIEVRKADGRPYENLSDDEQDELYENSDLSEHIKQEVIVTRRQILQGYE